MTRTTLRCLAWGHRRATGPLQPLGDAFRRLAPGIDIDWMVRPLSDFEHQSLDDIAGIYDLVIYDHPFSGAVIESGAFIALSSHEGTRTALARAGDYIGRSLTSYRVGGSVFGLPIDAATQNAVYRADLLAAAGEAVPQTWDEAITLGRTLAPRGLTLGLAIAAPHGGLVIAALMANAGAPWSTAPDAPFIIARAALLDAYEALAELVAFCPREVPGWNAIDLCDAMVARDDIVYAPCVYGYATYGEADQRRPLSFAAFAGRVAPCHAGSVLGGTGLAISRHSREQAAALGFVRFMASDEAQRIIALNHGQPALATLWHDAGIDRRFNGFFSATRRSVEAAWTRPRHRGYIAFQAAFGAAVARCLAEGAPGRDLWNMTEPLLEKVNP